MLQDRTGRTSGHTDLDPPRPTEQRQFDELVAQAPLRQMVEEAKAKSPSQAVRDTMRCICPPRVGPLYADDPQGHLPGCKLASKFESPLVHVPADPAAELSSWWRGQAEDEIDRTVAKAVEYGSRDLVEIGRDLARISGDGDISDPQAAELGVYFYLRGKLARWTEALADGREVSDDTLFDIGVYVRMAQRIRAVGGWPS